MNVNSSTIFLLMLDLILAFEGENYIFILHRLITWNKMRERKRTFDMEEKNSLEENGNHENHFEYFFNNNGTRAVSSMTGSLASNTNISVWIQCFLFLFIFQLMSCVCVFSSELRFVWPSCFDCKTSGWPKMWKQHFCFFTSLFRIRIWIWLLQSIVSRLVGGW